MSYDLAVFDPRLELRDPKKFYRWYDERTEWEDEIDYNDPANLTPALRAWFDDIIKSFPPLNGPFAYQGDDEESQSMQADFTLARDIIYVAFSWSTAEDAYVACLKLAEKHGIGFLDASGEEGAAWFPSDTGAIEMVHKASDE